MIDDLNILPCLGPEKNSSGRVFDRRDNCVCPGGGVLSLFLINLQWELHEFDFLGKGDPDPRPSSVSEQDYKYRF